MTTTLLVDKHVAYIQSLDKVRDIGYHFSAHLRLNGIYWGLTALALLGREDALPREEMIEWVMSCWVEEVGAFAPHPGHDPHVHATLSAVQVLITQGAYDVLGPRRARITSYVLELQDPTTGCFTGDTFGRELDTRFTCCSVLLLSLLGALSALDAPLPSSSADVEKKDVSRREATVDHLERCKNFDGGFGMVEGAESHAAYVWTSLGALAVLGRLDLVDSDTLSYWLCSRQLPNGGLNGRPEKLEDVCYSWWALASLSILGRAHWIDWPALSAFILSAQDDEKGGIADRPEDVADVWHTVFGVAGLSLMGYEGLKDVDPVYCMPKEVVEAVRLYQWPDESV